MSWFNLADSAIGAAVKVEEIKSKANANAGSQQQTISQPQAPQVTPKQVDAKPQKDNKLLLVAGGGAVLLIGAFLLMRK